jgi:epoxyqueuosine reductase
MTGDEAKAAIAAEAERLGIDMVRIAAASLPAHHQQTLDRWLDAGQHADMQYLARRRAGARPLTALLPDVRSVVVAAANYHRAGDAAPPPADAGEVSRYAVSRDYHRGLGNRLKRLQRYITTELGAGARWYVDTGAIFERAFAAAAGLGYVGRNTMLISKPYGSWVFLGVVLTTLELPPDGNQLKLSCGRCRRCLDACPTAAINDDMTVDARRCISYLTIENRGAIPESLRSRIGRWLFGCDICQTVCPHNHRAVATEVDDFAQVRIAGRALALADIISITSDDAFTARFAGTPVMRAKRRGLVRNACVVAGNIGSSALLAPLTAVAASDDSLLAEHARWAITEIEGRQTRG